MGGQGSGRKPLPTALKKLKGVENYRINHDEPEPGEAVIVPPTELNEAEREVWDRLAPDMIVQGVFTPWDVDAFRILVAAIVMNQDAIKQIQKNGLDLTVPEKELRDGTIVYRIVKNPAIEVFNKTATIIKQYGASFGMTPSDRSNIAVAGPQKKETLADPGRFLA